MHLVLWFNNEAKVIEWLNSKRVMNVRDKERKGAREQESKSNLNFGRSETATATSRPKFLRSQLPSFVPSITSYLYLINY